MTAHARDAKALKRARAEADEANAAAAKSSATLALLKEARACLVGVLKLISSPDVSATARAGMWLYQVCGRGNSRPSANSERYPAARACSFITGFAELEQRKHFNALVGSGDVEDSFATLGGGARQNRYFTNTHEFDSATQWTKASPVPQDQDPGERKFMPAVPQHYMMQHGQFRRFEADVPAGAVFDFPTAEPWICALS